MGRIAPLSSAEIIWGRIKRTRMNTT